jgi:hypothetical protein
MLQPVIFKLLPTWFAGPTAQKSRDFYTPEAKDIGIAERVARLRNAHRATLAV